MSVLKTYDTPEGYHPSKTFKIQNGRIEGMIDGLEAVRQAAELILSVERFVWPIYSSDYGQELESLVGKRRSYVEGDSRRRLEEALSQDDRFIKVEDFTLKIKRESAVIKAAIKTVFGSFELERRFLIE